MTMLHRLFPLLRKGLAALLAGTLAATALARPVDGTSATIGTEEAAAALHAPAIQPARPRHDRLHAALDRADLAAALRERGVSTAALHTRVDALSDAEAAALLAEIDRAPAGADVVGVLFSVFVILLVTDILGLTKVFPFTRAIR